MRAESSYEPNTYEYVSNNAAKGVPLTINNQSVTVILVRPKQDIKMASPIRFEKIRNKVTHSMVDTLNGSRFFSTQKLSSHHLQEKLNVPGNMLYIS